MADTHRNGVIDRVDDAAIFLDQVLRAIKEVDVDRIRIDVRAVVQRQGGILIERMRDTRRQENGIEGAQGVDAGIESGPRASLDRTSETKALEP